MGTSKIWPADNEPSVRYPLYTRGNVGEVFPNVMSVITGTMIGDEVNRATFDLMEEIGFLLERDLEPQRTATGVFAGYLYANVSMFRLMGVRAPGMKIEDVEQQVSGGATDMPPYERRKGDRSIVASMRLGRYMTSTLRRPDISPLDAARDDADRWLASMPVIDTATDDELLAFLGAYPRRLGDSMNRLLRFSMLASAPRALLDRVLERSKKAPAGLANRLVAGVGDVDSSQIAIRLWALGRIVADDATLSARFDAGLDGLFDDLAGSALEAPLQRFLDDLGHRCTDEYELAAPSWSMEPRPVLAAVDRLRHAPEDRSPDSVAARLFNDRAVAEEDVERAVARPLRRFVRHMASGARAGAIGRERAKDILVRENLGARMALHELYRRVGHRGGPESTLACSCVAIDELPAFVADPASFADVIAERLDVHAELSSRRPPMWFVGRIADPATWPRRDGEAAAAPLASTLSGIGVSSGRAGGPARVIADPSDPRGLEPGEVLVCAITDPSWTPLFLVAAAVVCDAGAVLSHAAIVARELGIPAVMSVEGITSVADGTWLDVDGDRGVVTIGSA